MQGVAGDIQAMVLYPATGMYHAMKCVITYKDRSLITGKVGFKIEWGGGGGQVRVLVPFQT